MCGVVSGLASSRRPAAALMAAVFDGGGVWAGLMAALDAKSRSTATASRIFHRAQVRLYAALDVKHDVLTLIPPQVGPPPPPSLRFLPLLPVPPFRQSLEPGTPRRAAGRAHAASLRAGPTEEGGGGAFRAWLLQ